MSVPAIAVVRRGPTRGAVGPVAAGRPAFAPVAKLSGQKAVPPSCTCPRLRACETTRATIVGVTGSARPFAVRSLLLAADHVVRRALRTRVGAASETPAGEPATVRGEVTAPPKHGLRVGALAPDLRT